MTHLTYKRTLAVSGSCQQCGCEGIKLCAMSVMALAGLNELAGQRRLQIGAKIGKTGVLRNTRQGGTIACTRNSDLTCFEDCTP